MYLQIHDSLVVDQTKIRIKKINKTPSIIIFRVGEHSTFSIHPYVHSHSLEVRKRKAEKKM